MMRRLLVLIALSAGILPAHAISRYEASRLSCDQAQSRIAREGAVILRYRSQRDSSLQLFDRYVSSGRWCQPGEFAKLEAVPTADTRRCPVLRCFQKTYDFD